MPKQGVKPEQKRQVRIQLARGLDQALEGAASRYASYSRRRQDDKVRTTVFLPMALDRAIEAIAFRRDVLKQAVIAEAIAGYLRKYPKGQGEVYKGQVIQNALEHYVAQRSEGAQARA